MTYPAPVLSPYDEWFSEPILTETQMEYKRMKEEYEHINDDPHDGWWLRPEHQEETKEPENIHQLMYEMATKSNSTTIQLDPLPTLGGSETFQEGPGGWMSGSGFNQYRG